MRIQHIGKRLKFLQKLLQISAIVLVVFSSCKSEIEEYPLEPKISFDKYQLNVNDSGGNRRVKLELFINFTDGDGNIGLSQEDIRPPFDSTFYFNIYVQYFEKIGNDFRQITTSHPFPGGDTINFNGRLPIIAADRKSVPTKGNIQYSIDMVTGPIASNTFKMRIWIYDRDLNKSNEIETPEIVVQ